MTYTSLNIDLKDRTVVLVGGGKVGLRKAKYLIGSQAHLKVISPILDPGFGKLAGKRFTHIEDTYDPKYLEGVFLVIGATDSPAINKQIYQDAKKRDILCNISRGNARSDFTFPALVDQGHLKIAISTSGHYPLLAKRIRQDLVKRYNKYDKDFLESLRIYRDLVLTYRRDHKEDLLDEALDMDLGQLRQEINKIKEDI